MGLIGCWVHFLTNQAFFHQEGIKFRTMKYKILTEVNCKKKKKKVFCLCRRMLHANSTDIV